MDDLPRERLARLGAQALTTKELLAIILGSGVSGADVFTVAERVEALDLHSVSVKSLQSLRGIGFAQSCKIVAAVALAQRLEKGPRARVVLSSPRAVFEHMKHIQHLAQEHFFGLYVDTRKQLVGEHLLFKGTADATIVHPRDIFRMALAENASGVIIVHNHPSGSCDPSEEDLRFTRRLLEAGDLLHIPLLDHVIIGTGFWSFVEQG